MDKYLLYFADITGKDILKFITEWYNITFFAIFCLLIAFLIYACTFYTKKKNKELILKHCSNVRLFSIHYEDGYVYAIDKFRFEKQRKESLNWFYESFTDKDKLRVTVWINELQKKEHKVPNHLELNVKIKAFKQPVFCVVSVSSIDYDKKIIHLESRLFPNIKKEVKKNSRKHSYVVNLNGLISLCDSQKTSPQNTFLIRLYSTKDIDTGEKRISHFISTLITSRLQKFCSSTRYVCQLNSNEIIIHDFKITTKTEAFAFAHTMATEISKILFISSINEYDFKIGIILEKPEEFTLTNSIKIAREMSIYAEDVESSSIAVIYDPSQSYQNETLKSIVSDIKLNMDKRLFSCNYIPIININSGNLFGYQCSLSAPQSLVSSIPDMQDYASHNNLLNELNRILYLETNSAMSRIDKRRRLTYTTMDLKLSQYLSYIDFYTHIDNQKNVTTIFIIEDKDIELDQNMATKVIAELKKANMTLGLKITSTELNVLPELLSVLDFFFIYHSSFTNITEPQHQILYSDMISKLKTYPARIVSLEIPSMSYVDLACRNGISLISSPLLGNKEKTLPEIEAKKLAKFTAIAKQY